MDRSTAHPMPEVAARALPVDARPRPVVLVRPHVARRLAIAVLLVAPLLLGELGVRALIATHRLPAAAGHHKALEISWTNYERKGPTDILVLGDSVARMGIDPTLLGELASDTAGRPVTAYNLATPGAGLRLNLALVQQLAREGRLPRIAIIGLSVDGIERREDGLSAALRSPLGHLVSGCSGAADLEAMLSCRLEQASALWRWRGQLPRLFEGLAGQFPEEQRENAAQLRPDGFGQAGAARSAAALERQVPRTLKKVTPFTRPSNVDQRYAALVAALRQNGVSVIGVSMPVATQLEAALEVEHPGWLGRRSAVLDTLGTATDAPLVRLERVDGTWTYREFHDVKHFSNAGARRFTKWMWGQETIRQAVRQALSADEPTN
jgi:hypothetical protein